MSGPVRTRSGVRSCIADGDSLNLVLNNGLDAIEQGREALIGFLAPYGLSARVINRLDVIFEELVANTVRHGFEPQSDQSIHIRAHVRTDGLELVFEDDGTPFNLLEAPSPEPLKTLDAARIGGLGLPLVIKLSSSLSYERPKPQVKPDGFSPTNHLLVTIATSG